MTDRFPRLDYVDGLRGIAIGLVVLTHAWTQNPPKLWNPTWSHNRMSPGPHASWLDYIANRGYQGVSLFLVLSGFCLAYPALKRRADGAKTWFSPRHFFARRILRILPPYYVALGISISLVTLFRFARWPYLRAMGSYDVGPANVITHLLLVHNLTSYAFNINSPFWSLALEWQWYWIFPLVLLAAIRFPLWTAMSTLVVAAAWQAMMEDLPIIMSWLPGRLFEFCCGVLVARLVVRGFRCPASVLLGGVLGSVVLAEAPIGTVVGDAGMYQPLYGVAFALLLLLASTNLRAQAILSGKPLVRLGLISYSVYLVHRPASDIVESFAPLWLRSSYLIIPVAAAAGMTAGYFFHLVVERPCMSQSAWRFTGPSLERCMGWTDRVFGVQRSLEQPYETAPAVTTHNRASA